MRRFLIAGNWKMNTVQQSAEGLAADLAEAARTEEGAVEVLVCPPAPYLIPVREKLAGSAVKLGAQDVYFEAPGAFTGEVCGEMLLDCGCSYVLVGHSERRAIIGECNKLVNNKVKAALEAGLTVVLCVGSNSPNAKADRQKRYWTARWMAVFRTSLSRLLARSSLPTNRFGPLGQGSRRHLNRLNLPMNIFANGFPHVIVRSSLIQ